ncbi:hypothetical protein PENCOP_c011G05804 [Penicillium coprophilum]|uniref:Uncharacterized protein n=1 Tax=Penicillium coprophilum TaxID=36646 RepID=A0A1V6UE77_9EURO|nr:hypothetical protein PENCOP_c011G05804 [Penicillium coprophilum]
MELSDPASTQTDDLPPFQEITITNVNRLSEISDLQSWTAQIQLLLANVNLLALISPHFPYPIPAHPNYDSWLKWSQLVSKWLTHNVKEEFSTFLRSIRPHLKLADETYQMIIDLLSPDEENIETNEFIKLWSMRRRQFESIGTYVNTWRAQVNICEQLELGISGYAATKLMLHELREEMPDVCRFINNQIGRYDSTSGSMGYEEFNNIVNDILDILYQGNPPSI